MNSTLYPLQFEPILKERIWGGEKLRTDINKSISTKTTGESWEISTVENDISIVSNGIMKGKSLNEIIHENPKGILGSEVYKRFGTQFPLLFKFIDAKEDLSIQVHPNDELAKKRHNSFGKTEMWYIMQADKGARIIVGFKDKSSPEEYLRNLQNKSLLTILDEVEAEEGDVFFLETGTIHAIGGGILLAEIQQTSDITYRVYDWDRVDADGKSRELHIDLAIEAINYDKIDTQKTYWKKPNQSNNVVDCPFFTTNYIALDGVYKLNKNGDSFTVFMCVDGALTLEVLGKKYQYAKGDTFLMPAAISSFALSGKGSLLEIYIS